MSEVELIRNNETKNLETELESKLVVDDLNEDEVEANKKKLSSSSSTSLTSTTPPPQQQQQTNELTNLDAKQKKKYDKLVDSIIKKSNSSTDQPISTETKYYLIIQKYVELQETQKKFQLQQKESEKMVQNYIKQRDLIQTDYNKSILAKNKLESLCRELQKHNKLIKEENLQRMKEEEDKRKEISNKFQSAIDEINSQVNSNTEKNNGLIQENLQLTTKLKNLLEQYEAREQQVEKLLKHKDLENQLANAKFQQSELKLAELTERHKSEKAIYENHCIELNKKCEFHQEAEKQLRSQLGMYTEKYEEFQNTLKKSNQVFESFRTEMDKMTKKIKKLEQETSLWKSKCETSDKCLQSVIKQKDDLETRYKKMQAKADMMEKLSRTLQTERNELKEKLKVYEPQPIEQSQQETQQEESKLDTQESEQKQTKAETENESTKNEENSQVEVSTDKN